MLFSDLTYLIQSKEKPTQLVFLFFLTHFQYFYININFIFLPPQASCAVTVHKENETSIPASIKLGRKIIVIHLKMKYF